ncbi:hypothetical protein [Anoxybacteroides tepidamans]|uniref:hypothetical protein n=1 Tax=Anoxybacteroides tepidamans TaxID=265948 RepID=UPI0006890C1C|nr:hypothetical protein [Anoxybacillus tepidamans]
MPMEQETLGMLIGGFSLVMGISFIIVFRLFLSRARKPLRIVYGFILAYFIFFSSAVVKTLEAIMFDVNHLMASEEISWRLGTAGVLWAISMVFLLLGIIKVPPVFTNKEANPSPDQSQSR